jgi:hypothetical protein
MDMPVRTSSHEPSNKNDETDERSMSFSFMLAIRYPRPKILPGRHFICL